MVIGKAVVFGAAIGAPGVAAAGSPVMVCNSAPNPVSSVAGIDATDCAAAAVFTALTVARSTKTKVRLLVAGELEARPGPDGPSQ